MSQYEVKNKKVVKHSTGNIYMYNKKYNINPVTRENKNAK